MPSLLGCKDVIRFSPDAALERRPGCRGCGLKPTQGVACSLFVPGSVPCVTTSKHSVELVDREGEIADVLAAVEDFLLARATYEAARQQWPKEHIRLRQETRIVEDGSDPH